MDRAGAWAVTLTTRARARVINSHSLVAPLVRVPQVSVFAVVEERSSPFAAQHDPKLTSGASFTKNMINGWEFCNMPAGGITLRTGERVRGPG